MAGVTQGRASLKLLLRYGPYLQECHRLMVEELQKSPSTSILTRYFERGKMLRSLLVLAVTAAIGNDPGKMLAAAAAVELLHGASLVHDDIVDEASTRRGLPALHRQVGLGPALVLGDFLILQAFAVLRQAETFHSREHVCDALYSLNEYARTCCLGEVDELFLSRQGHLEEEDYLALVRGKTAAPFAAAATMPAILGGAPLTELEALRSYGLNLGIAYQIHDDLCDLIGNPQLLGKPVGESLMKGRPLLPLIYVEEYGSVAARTILGCLRRGDTTAWPALTAMLKAEGIIARVHMTQACYVEHAIAALTMLRPSHDVTDLRIFATSVTTLSQAMEVKIG